MKIEVEVKLHAKNERIEKINPNVFRVFINAKPIDGEANKRIFELLAEYFGVAKSLVTLVSGGKSRKKIFFIDQL